MDADEYTNSEWEDSSSYDESDEMDCIDDERMDMDERMDDSEYEAEMRSDEEDSDAGVPTLETPGVVETTVVSSYFYNAPDPVSQTSGHGAAKKPNLAFSFARNVASEHLFPSLNVKTIDEAPSDDPLAKDGRPSPFAGMNKLYPRNAGHDQSRNVTSDEVPHLSRFASVFSSARFRPSVFEALSARGLTSVSGKEDEKDSLTSKVPTKNPSAVQTMSNLANVDSPCDQPSTASASSVMWEVDTGPDETSEWIPQTMLNDPTLYDVDPRARAHPLGMAVPVSPVSVKERTKEKEREVSPSPDDYISLEDPDLLSMSQSEPLGMGIFCRKIKPLRRSSVPRVRFDLPNVSWPDSPPRSDVYRSGKESEDNDGDNSIDADIDGRVHLRSSGAQSSRGSRAWAAKGQDTEGERTNISPIRTQSSNFTLQYHSSLPSACRSRASRTPRPLAWSYCPEGWFDLSGKCRFDAWMVHCDLLFLV